MTGDLLKGLDKSLEQCYFVPLFTLPQSIHRSLFASHPPVEVCCLSPRHIYTFPVQAQVQSQIQIQVPDTLHSRVRDVKNASIRSITREI